MKQFIFMTFILFTVFSIMVCDGGVQQIDESINSPGGFEAPLPKSKCDAFQAQGGEKLVLGDWYRLYFQNCVSKESVLDARKKIIKKHFKRYNRGWINHETIKRRFAGLKMNGEGDKEILPRLHTAHVLREIRNGMHKQATVSSLVKVQKALSAIRLKGEDEREMYNEVRKMFRDQSVKLYFYMNNGQRSDVQIRAWNIFRLSCASDATIKELLKDTDWWEFVLGYSARRRAAPNPDFFTLANMTGDQRVKQFQRYTGMVQRGSLWLRVIDASEKFRQAGHDKAWVHKTTLDLLIQKREFLTAFRYAAKYFDKETIGKVEALHKEDMRKHGCYSVGEMPDGQIARIFNLEKGCTNKL